MTVITRRGLLGAGALAGLTFLAGCKDAGTSEDVTTETDSKESEVSQSESELSPEQQAILEDSEPLDEDSISANAALTYGYATSDGTWDYITSGAGIYRQLPDGSRRTCIWQGDDFKVAHALCEVDGWLYFIGWEDSESTTNRTVYRLDTDSFDVEPVYFYGDKASGYYAGDQLAVIDGRIYLALHSATDADPAFFVTSLALDGTDERQLWTTDLAFARFAFTREAIWCAGGDDEDPTLIRIDLATLGEETLLDSSSGMTSIGELVVIEGTPYFEASFGEESGIWRLGTDGIPERVSANELLGATGGFIYTHEPQNEEDMQSPYSFTRVDLANMQEEPFAYPIELPMYSTQFEFYGLGNRLLINIEFNAYTTALDGEVIFAYVFDPNMEENRPLDPDGVDENVD